MSAGADRQARRLAREAAQWLALQDAGELDADAQRRLQGWRARSAAHEALWQRAERLRRQFAQVPAPVGLSCLDRPDPERRKLLTRTLALAAGAPLAWLVCRELPLERWRADLATATGERRGLALPDGSRLQLNTASAVNLDYVAGQLRVEVLQGELALDARGPFLIQTRHGRIEADAARLSVRQASEASLVSALRGELQLLPRQGRERPLEAGQRAWLGADGIAGVRPFDAQLPDWQQGLLIVENQPLGQFLRELARYRPGLLRWPPSLERLAVTGTFLLDDTDRVLALLAASLPVQVHYRTRYWVSLSPRGAPA